MSRSRYARSSSSACSSASTLTTASSGSSPNQPTSDTIDATPAAMTRQRLPDVSPAVRLRGGARQTGGGARRDVVSDAADGDAGRDSSEAQAAPFGVDDDGLGGAREAAVEWEVQRARGDRGRAAVYQSFRRFARRRVAVAGRQLVEINPQVAALARESEEEVLQREVVEDGDACMSAHRVEDARVVAVVVAHVVDDRVELFESEQGGRV